MKQQAQAWWNQATQMVVDAADQEQQFAFMVEQLASRDPHVSVPAIWALQQAGPIVIPTLLTGLQHPHTRVRRNCIDIIDHGGYGGNARCIEALLPLLRDPVPHIRRAVWHALFCERCRDESRCEVDQAVEPDEVALLIEIGLQEPNLKLRRQLVGKLEAYFSDPRVPPALERILRTESDGEILAGAQRLLCLQEGVGETDW